jgi:hypothetical protein
MVENKCPAFSRGAAETADLRAQKIAIPAGGVRPLAASLGKRGPPKNGGVEGGVGKWGPPFFYGDGGPHFGGPRQWGPPFVGAPK